MFIRRSIAAAFLILSVSLWIPDPALAAGQPIRVEEAIPNEAEQGQLLLPVKIKGKGFGPDAQVRFLVHGTDIDDEIDVISVNYDPVTKDLDTVINVSSGAAIDSYDILVTSSGRGGKGTDLFRVTEKGSGSTGQSTLSADFCLLMTDLEPGLASDDHQYEIYCDSRRDKVWVFTSNGPGFRFDTNSTSQKNPRRLVQFNVPSDAIELYHDTGYLMSVFASGQYVIDFRFTLQNGGLDLGALGLFQTGYVPVEILIETADLSEKWGVAYGNDFLPFSHGYLVGNTCVDDHTQDAMVTRLAVDMWEIRSNSENANACLWSFAGGELGNQVEAVINLPFAFVIEIQ